MLFSEKLSNIKSDIEFNVVLVFYLTYQDRKIAVQTKILKLVLILYLRISFYSILHVRLTFQIQRFTFFLLFEKN